MALMIILTIAIPPLALFMALVGFYINPSKWKLSAFFYIISIAMLAYSFEFYHINDLGRYYQEIEAYSGRTLAEMMSEASDGLYFRTLFFWTISKTSDRNLLQMISVGSVYGIATYITCDMADREDKTQWILPLLVLQSLLLPFDWIVSNVRNIFAFSMISLAVYRDLIQKKLNLVTLLLYIAPLFLHTSAVLLIVARIVAPLLKHEKILVAVCAIFIPVIITLLYQNVELFSFIPIFSNIIVKMYGYLNPTGDLSEWAAIVQASAWQRVYKMVFLIYILVFLILLWHRAYEDKEIRKSNFVSYVFILSVLTFASQITSTPQYWRFGAALTIVQGATLVMIMKNLYKGIEGLLYKFIWVIAICCPVMHLYQYPGQTDIGAWLMRFLTNNPFIIIFNVLKNLIL